MDKQILEKKIINVAYNDLINIFNKTTYYFRPIIYNGTTLWKDDKNDEKRCNIIFQNDRVYKIDGWY